MPRLRLARNSGSACFPCSHRVILTGFDVSQQLARHRELECRQTFAMLGHIAKMNRGGSSMGARAEHSRRSEGRFRMSSPLCLQKGGIQDSSGGGWQHRHSVF